MNILLNCNTITKIQDNTVLLLFSVIAILIIGCIIMFFYFSTVQPKIRSSYLTAKNKRLIKNGWVYMQCEIRSTNLSIYH